MPSVVPCMAGKGAGRGECTVFEVDLSLSAFSRNSSLDAKKTSSGELVLIALAFVAVAPDGLPTQTEHYQ